MEDDNELLLEALNEINSLPRQHASFYNWKDKGIKEAGVIEEFLDPDNHCGRHWFTSTFYLETDDPPDAWVVDSDGGRTALEVVELVNEKAIEAQIKKDSLRCREEAIRWKDLAYFERRLNDEISKKDKKCEKLFASGRKVQLLLHSDELFLLAYYRHHLNQGLELADSRFDRVWLLLSYDSKTRKHPLLELT